MSFLNFQYFFDVYPPAIKDVTFLIVVIVSFLFLLIAFALKFLLSKKRSLSRKFDKYQKSLCLKLINWFFTAGITNLMLIYIRRFRIPYLQTRFLLFLWWAIIFVWLVTIIQHYLVKIPELREIDKKRKEYEKYLK